MEKRGDYLYGTQDEINDYQTQQGASNMAAGAIAGLAGIAVVTVVIVASIAKSYQEMKQRDLACGEQIERWHNMYSNLWGEKKADLVLNRAKKKLNFKTIPLILIPFFFVTLLAIMVNMSSILDSIPDGLKDFSTFTNAIETIKISVIYMPIHSKIMIGSVIIFHLLWMMWSCFSRSESILLDKYHATIYKSYQKIKCPHCGKKAFVLSLGQCRKCFKFIRKLSPADTQALSEYEMKNHYDLMTFEGNEFFSQEVGRTFSWIKGLPYLLFSILVPLFLLAVFGYLEFLLWRYVAANKSIGIGFLALFSLPLLYPFIVIPSKKVGNLFNKAVGRDIQKFISSVKTELLKHNRPTGNWE
ncbi:MAG: hypothetical protein FWE80_00260 [Oscillospiraceae bacterium]|nr:hypothetical protein [Oscillospiraceae bacterium]